METHLATWELCSSNPAQCCSALCGKQDHIWEAGLPGMTEIRTTWYFTFYFGFPLNLVHFNALFFLRLWVLMMQKHSSVAMFFQRKSMYSKCWALNSVHVCLQAYCCLIAIVSSFSGHDLQPHNESGKTCQILLAPRLCNLLFPRCSPDSSFSHPKHRSQQVTNDSWKVKHYQKLHETLSKRTFIYNSPSEPGKLCIPSVPENGEKICSSNHHQKLHKSIHILEYLHSDLQHLEFSIQNGWWI